MAPHSPTHSSTHSSTPDQPEPRRRGAHWEQLSRGVQIPTGLTGHDRLIAELAAFSHLVPPSGVWSGLTALRIHDLWLPDLPPLLPHFIAIGNVRGEVKPERHQLRVMRHPTSPGRVVIDGLIVQPVAEALREAANVLGLLDLIVAVDCALHTGLCTMADLRLIAAERRRGVRLLRTALLLADGRAESPWESLLRLLHVVCGIDVIPQFELFDAAGRFAARGDLLVRGTKHFQEYDGGQHRDPVEHLRDLERERRIADAGGVRRGYVARDLLERPYEILRPAAEALGWPHPPSAEPWLELLAGSLRTPAGRRLLLRRVGLSNWS